MNLAPFSFSCAAYSSRLSTRKAKWSMLLDSCLDSLVGALAYRLTYLPPTANLTSFMPLVSQRLMTLAEKSFSKNCIVWSRLLEFRCTWSSSNLAMVGQFFFGGFGIASPFAPLSEVLRLGARLFIRSWPIFARRTSSSAKPSRVDLICSPAG